MADWHFPTYTGLKQIFKQENINRSFIISYLKVTLKKSIMRFLSIKYIKNL